jgi:hypothetical protein
MTVLESEPIYTYPFQPNQEALAIADSLTAFQQQHSGLPGGEERAGLAIHLANELRTRLDQFTDVERAQSLELFQPKALIDILDWQACNELWICTAGGLKGQVDRSRGSACRPQEFRAKQQVFEDIRQYDRLSHGVPSAYIRLLENFHATRLVVKNHNGYLAESDDFDRIALDHLLTIYKTLKALKNSGFSRTRYTDMVESDKSNDLVVPIGRTDKREVLVKVQRAAREEPPNMVAIGGRWILLNVSYETNGRDPFNMDEEDKKIAKQAVRQARLQMLKVAPNIKIRPNAT